jgi:hypothetical protein
MALSLPLFKPVTRARTRSILFIAGVLLGCLFLSAAVQFVLASALDAFSGATTGGAASWANGGAGSEDLNRILSSIETFPAPTGFFVIPGTPAEQAANLYLRSYWLSFGRDGQFKDSAKDFEKRADMLLGPDDYTECVFLLDKRAQFCDRVLNLPHLAEACERCAVFQCRRRYQEKRAPEARLLLAISLKHLADIYTRHQKLEIATRAYADAVFEATMARGLGVGNEQLRATYFAWVGLYVNHEQPEAALTIIDRMIADKVI